MRAGSGGFAHRCCACNLTLIQAYLLSCLEDEVGRGRIDCWRDARSRQIGRCGSGRHLQLRHLQDLLEPTLEPLLLADQTRFISPVRCRLKHCCRYYHGRLGRGGFWCPRHCDRVAHPESVLGCRLEQGPSVDKDEKLFAGIFRLFLQLLHPLQERKVIAGQLCAAADQDQLGIHYSSSGTAT